MDIRNQCSGFLYSLAAADAFVRIGMYKRILVVGAEVHSSGLNFTDEGRDVSVIFGDGAGAVIVGPSEDPSRGILSNHLHADGRFADILRLEMFDISQKPCLTHEMLDRGSLWPKMKGKEVFRVAVTKIPEVIEEALKANNLKVEDVDLFIPHQANLRINQFAAAKLGVPEEKFYSNIQRYGNTTAASLPICPERSAGAGPDKGRQSHHVRGLRRWLHLGRQRDAVVGAVWTASGSWLEVGSCRSRVPTTLWRFAKAGADAALVTNSADQGHRSQGRCRQACPSVSPGSPTGLSWCPGSR